MADETNSAGEKPPMHPKLAEFLDDVFPNDGRRHTLALGENHGLSEHTLWLRDHLGELKARGVNSIGLEYAAFMNVFLWAYEDGTLARALGSQQAAKDYIENVWSVASTHAEASRAQARFVTDALDAGICVTCYDTRRTFNHFSKTITDFLESHPQQAEQIKQLMQNNDRSGVSAQIAIEKETRPSSYHFFNPFEQTVPGAWMHHELMQLLHDNPDYQKKIEAIDTLINTGYQSIRKERIGSDGLSACMLQALAPEHGNRITIGGLSHNNGLPELSKHAMQNTHGLFPHHMQQLAEHSAGREFRENAPPSAHRVSTVVLACNTTIQRYKDEGSAYQDFSARSEGKCASIYVPSAIPIISLDDGAQHTLLSYNKDAADRLMDVTDAYAHYAYAKPHLTEQWFFSCDQLDTIQQSRAKQFANPMLIPELKKACDKVHAAIHGETARAR